MVKVLNGKKTPIALILFAATAILGYGNLQNVVATNKEEIKDLKKTPIEVAQLEQKVVNLHENFNEFKTEQRVFNKDMRVAMTEILKAVHE